MLLFVDTETTGKLDFKLPLTHPAQPRLVQLAVWVGRDVEGECRFEAQCNLIVRPDGWTIPDDAARVHGITTERALAFGEPLGDVLTALMHLVALADDNMSAGRMIAHNVAFDNRVLLSELARTGGDVTALGMLRPFCTMQALTPRMRLPNKWNNGHKWPTLDEAYRFCFEREIADRTTHNAMIDLLACKDIFLHGRAQGWWQ